METPSTPTDGPEAAPTREHGTLARVARYALVRLLTVALMVVIGVYLAIVVINLGGYIDEIYRANIEDALLGMSMAAPDMPAADKLVWMEETRAALTESLGLNEPFLLRCVRWLYDGLTLGYGDSQWIMYVKNETESARDVILDRTPATLLLVGSANLLVFIASVAGALSLSRRHGGILDKLLVALSPISSIPNWIYGVILILVFAAELHILPFGGMHDPLPAETAIGKVAVILKHMILPVTAIFLSMFFQATYTWRTLFLVYAGEDYVDLAKAQGLPARTIERRYVLQPVLPYIITSFALMLVTFWQGAVVLEQIFNWPGIASLFMTAIRVHDSAIATGLIVLFAYFLAITVLVLDVAYALVDPRVRLGSRSGDLRTARPRRHFWPVRLGRTPLALRRLQTGETRPAPDSSGLPAASSRFEAPARKTKRAGAFLPALREAARYPSAIVGLVIIFVLVGVAIYTPIAIPRQRAIEIWRGQNVDRRRIPAIALPAWINFFRKDDLPPTIALSSLDGTARKTVKANDNGTTSVSIAFEVDYPYGAFPKDLAIYFQTPFTAKKPFVALTWTTPDGRVFDLGGHSLRPEQAFIMNQDLPRKYRGAGSRTENAGASTGGTAWVEELFVDPASERRRAVEGVYRMQVDGLTFEPGSDVEAELIIDGRVYGLAGTDMAHRDLTVALMWGLPIALTIGFAGAVVTSLCSMMLAAVAAWFGGWVDDAIQRLTEITMMLPALPLAISVYFLYSHSVWAVLGVIVLLNVFGSTLKNYRAVFLQVKEAPFIEAAVAYGAGSRRVIARYLVPRIVPLLVPQLVILIPTYIFFEATLGFLGVSDPVLPTWGKLIYDAVTTGAFQSRYFYWLLEPLSLMILAALAFAMVGFALDGVLNPRLRRR